MINDFPSGTTKAIYSTQHNSRNMLEIKDIPSGYTRVKPEEIPVALQNSGNRGAVLFFKGDKIAVSDIVASRTATLNGKEQLVYCIGVQINDQKPKFIPLASFRQFPRDAQELLSKNAFMRSLYDGSDADRFALLSGKNLTVTELLEGEGIDWQKSDASTKNFVYKTKKFPVFVCE